MRLRWSEEAADDFRTHTSRQRALDPPRILGDLLRERVPWIAAALPT